MKRRRGALMLSVVLATALLGAPACQRMVEVQTGTRIVDSQGKLISEDIHTVRVPANTAGAYRVVTITQPAANPQIASLYAQVQTAIAAGNLPLAEAKLKQLLAITPTYRRAKQQHDAIAKGQKVTPDLTPSKPTPSTPRPSTPTPPSGEPTATAGSLLRWVPDALAGFSAAKAGVDPLSVSREYVSGAGNPARTLVVVAEQFRTASDAKRALQAEVKNRYPSSASSSSIHGHATYFGTDGREFAAIGFTSGAVLVAAEASPDSGSPSQLKSLLAKVVEQLP